MTGRGASVPCAGCTACCQNDMLMLHPECGDDPAQYETEAVLNPLTGKPGLMLKHKPNGGCWYLGADGCPWGIARFLCNAPADSPTRLAAEASDNEENGRG